MRVRGTDSDSGDEGPHAPRRRKIALLIETSQWYGRGLLGGIGRYINKHKNWSVTFEGQSLADKSPAWFSRWRGDGIMLRSASEKVLQTVQQRSVPIVYLGEFRDTALPTLHSDDRGIAQLAIEHLCDRGIEHFGFVGLPGIGWSDRRRQHSHELLAARGYDCEVFQYAPFCVNRNTWLTQEKSLSEWLQSLRKPAGIITCCDLVGVRVLDVCRVLGLDVPEQVAVIGVDDDPQYCQLAEPPLSSVTHDLEQISWRAAALLDRLIEGKEHEEGAVVIAPLGVSCRQSTDVVAIPDRQVARAWRFIREHACDGIEVGDVARFVRMHPATLRRRFELHVGRSPKAEIMRLQLERVKHLLRETELPLERIADMAGFRYVQYLSVLFRRKEGIPPSEYRHRNKPT